MKKVVALILGTLLVVSILNYVAFASQYNYATNTHSNPLYYDGYVQIKSSYNDSGRHAARGRFTYKNGRDGTKTYYTAWGSGYKDAAIHSKSARYYDTLDPFAPKTTFSYNFNWLPHDKAVAGNWPV